MEIKVADKSYDLSRLTIVEAEAIEKVTGQKMQDALSSGTAASLRALVWVAMKRQEPTLRYSDVDFALEDVEVIAPEDEADPTTGPSVDTAD